MQVPKRFKLIGCAVLYRECYYCAAVSRNIVDVQILEQGLHDVGEAKMCSRLQREIDAVDKAAYDAILLAYGLCSNGIRHLRSSLPLVVPRAHDCITLLMGSKEKYQSYFDANPGTEYWSIGWCERQRPHLSNPESTTRMMGLKTYQEYVDEYGEENAKYIMESLGGGQEHYTKLAYIETGIGETRKYKDEKRKAAESRNWVYEEIEGSTHIITRLMSGDWDQDSFLVVHPGETIEPSYDNTVVKLVE
jgi:hypothetical protein